MNTYDAWYMRPEWFIYGSQGKMPNPAKLEGTHVKIKTLEAENPERAFVAMQAERWSPNGEAREIIRSAGLAHTSMSVGDVLVEHIETTLNMAVRSKVWIVAMIGFKELK